MARKGHPFTIMFDQVTEVLSKLRREKNKIKGPWLVVYQLSNYIIEGAALIRDSSNRIATSIDKLEAPSTLTAELEKCIKVGEAIDNYTAAMSEIVNPGHVIQGKFKVKLPEPSHPHNVTNRIEVSSNASLPSTYYRPNDWDNVV